MMRRILLVAVVAAGIVNCEPEPVEVLPTDPIWMEWPAEVLAAVPFDVRLITYAPGCFDRQELRIAVYRNGFDVMIAPRWLVEGQSNPACLRDPGYIDTAVSITGLGGNSDQTYEFHVLATREPPFRLWGSVLVRTVEPVADRVNGGGTVTGFTDIGGCAVMNRPFGLPVPVENPPSPAWQGFVRGYFFTPAAPLCGQTRAFHLEAGP